MKLVLSKYVTKQILSQDKISNNLHFILAKNRQILYAKLIIIIE